MDSWAWMEYIAGNSRLKAKIADANLKTPVLVLSEIERALRRKGISESQCVKILERVCNRSILLFLDSASAIAAGRIAFEQGMHLSDAVVYSFASAECPVLTGDPDFRGKKNVDFL